MARLPHGYTNLTRYVGDAVEKQYEGPRRWDNARREMACLRALAERLPVPGVIEAGARGGAPYIRLAAVPGRHGQELLDEGKAASVLTLVGHALRELQSLPPSTVADLAGEGPVIVHGDFGPQNMLFAGDPLSTVAILDWESAHRGAREEDLAWAEWIVRMHHPRQADALDELFSAAQLWFGWRRRHDAMLRQCRDVLAYCEWSGMDEAAADWWRRLEETERWHE